MTPIVARSLAIPAAGNMQAAVELQRILSMADDDRHPIFLVSGKNLKIY
jgi:hypothetical protein